MFNSLDAAFVAALSRTRTVTSTAVFKLNSVSREALRLALTTNAFPQSAVSESVRNDPVFVGRAREPLRGLEKSRDKIIMRREGARRNSVATARDTPRSHLLDCAALRDAL